MNKTDHQLTREQQAMAEIGHTDIGRGAALALAMGFLAVILSVPAIQIAAAWRMPTTYPSPVAGRPLRSLLAAIPDGATGWNRLLAANRVLLRRMNEFEDDIEDDSVVGKFIRPRLQLMMAAGLGAGNEQVLIGRQGTLFYQADLQSVTGPGFLDPSRLSARARSGNEWETPIRPDPRPAIRDFQRALAERGILLVIMPVPVKPTIDPNHFTKRAMSPASLPRNTDFKRLLAELERDGIAVFDPAAIMAALPAPGDGAGRYLATDTHWRPQTMRGVADALAGYLHDRGVFAVEAAAPAAMAWDRVPTDLTGIGDLVRMLDLPADQRLYPPETVRIEPVLTADGQFWRPDPHAAILLLGDSFSNIYAFEPLGWGESAGFAEQLSRALGRPLDRIVRNDGGAHATRAMLAAELARGRDRLAGKRVLIWQFAERELALGDWPVIPMNLGQASPSGFLEPAAGETIAIRGTVHDVAAAPRPGTVTYRDHVVAVHLVDIDHERTRSDGGEALVYLWSMRDNQWTRAARLRRGDVIELRLTDWDTVADRVEAVNRAELGAVELMLAAPWWGEWPEER